MAGFSSTFSDVSLIYKFENYLGSNCSQDGQFYILGAPGFSRWRGTIVSYDTRKSLRPGNEVPITDVRSSIYSYLGYSMTTGNFYRGMSVQVASGAPKDSDYIGSVS